MLTVTVNTTRLVRRLRAARQRRAGARTQALKLIAGPAMAALVHAVPRDTNRLVNSYIDAAYGAGVGAYVGPKFPIRPSKHEANQRAALERQVARKQRDVRYWRSRVAVLARTVDRQQAGGLVVRAGQAVTRSDASRELAEARRNLARSENDVGRAQREAAKFRDGRGDVVFGIFGAGRAGRRIGTTVANRVYGGSGSIRESPSATVMFFRSREPHAAIIESRDHQVRNLKRSVKQQVGLGPAKRAVVKQMNDAMK